MMGAGHISIRALLIFIDVYETQNFSVVARREGISASQVSRVIHQLEDALGQQLFYRNTRAIMPTESGHLFVRYARAMAGNMEDARRELDERAREPSGTLRINGPVFFGQRHIAPGLPGLLARYPRLSIELTLTDDFIDPHRDAADVIFRIGADGLLVSRPGVRAAVLPSGGLAGLSTKTWRARGARRSQPSPLSGLPRLVRA
ncbi:LysR family transcriptional regulator [Enterobacter hormaechei]|nr:LysR family transcriptional regulator [Enterobacter hormaechei]